MKLLAVLAVLDGFGIYGKYLHYGIVIALVGSAFLIFVYLWMKRRLDMDEGPKYQMMEEQAIGEIDILQEQERMEGGHACRMKEKMK